MTTTDSTRNSGRIIWLDITRVLCALMIVSFHWLRASYKVGLVGPAATDLLAHYQANTGGFRLFQEILIARSNFSVSDWLTNSIGLVGGFGWEAVNALILVSGFSLAISQRGKKLNPSEWVSWLLKRAKRVLVPYYWFALPLLAFSGLSILILHQEHGYFAHTLETKLLSQFTTPVPGVILSHILLFDPWGVQLSANFLAPAWWFVPAILIAYLTYPAVRAASRLFHGIPLLVASAAITVVSYSISEPGPLIYEMWYFIVLHEAFAFSLGIVVAGYWLNGGRPALERMVSDPRVLVIAIAGFLLGNVMNWTSQFHPFASMVYGPSLLVALAYVGTRLERNAVGRKLLAVDSYDLYLVHQPFAFPLALLSETVFHRYATFVGFFLFMAVSLIAARLLAIVQRINLPRSPSALVSLFRPRAKPLPAHDANVSP